jgi:hypothetical protein
MHKAMNDMAAEGFVPERNVDHNRIEDLKDQLFTITMAHTAPKSGCLLSNERLRVYALSSMWYQGRMETLSSCWANENGIDIRISRRNIELYQNIQKNEDTLYDRGGWHAKGVVLPTNLIPRPGDTISISFLHLLET